MSSIFQGLVNSSGKLKVGLGPITNWFRSVPLNAAGEIVIGAGPIVRYSHGIPYNAAGEVVGLQSTIATRHGSGATPYGPNGELEASGTPPVDHVYQGVPYTAGGIYATSGGAAAPVIVAKDFTITPAQISASSAGFRASPAAGTLAPDAAYGGGTIYLVQAVNDDEFRVQASGAVPFPGISGNLTVQFPVYLGPNRIILPWDGISNWYVANVPGIYTYMVSQIGLATSMRFAAAPSGTA